MMQTDEGETMRDKLLVTSKPLTAYHGKPEIKKEYLARVRKHREADELQHGYYWKNGKGCAVGCTIHGSHHMRYETELGIPAQLAYIEDSLFESLPNGKAKEWPEKFLGAIPIGANLYIPYWQFMQWLLIDPEEGVIKFVTNPEIKQAVEQVGGYYTRLLTGGTITEAEWEDALDARIRQSEKLLELLRNASTVRVITEETAA